MVPLQPSLRRAALGAMLALAGLSCQSPRQELHAITAPPQGRQFFEVPACVQTLAVLDVRVQRAVPVGVTEDFGLPITERIEAAFLATGRFDVVERNRIHVVQHELAKSMDDLWVDQATVAKIGKFLGVRYLALPSARVEVGVFSTSIGLQVKVVEVETAVTLESFNVKTSSASPSVNTSLNSCLEKLPDTLLEVLRPIYPARAQVVRVGADGQILATTRMPRLFKSGEKVRLLRVEVVGSAGKEGPTAFLVEGGIGRVGSVEPSGIVVKTRDRVEKGWIVEALP